MPDLRICYTKLILSFIAPAVLLRGIVSVDPCLLQREERAAGTTSQSEVTVTVHPNAVVAGEYRRERFPA